MNLKRIATLFFFITGLALTGCGGGSGGGSAPSPEAEASLTSSGPSRSARGLFNVSVVWSPGLEAGSLSNSAVVHFTSSEGDHVPAVLKNFRLYMTTMGHGSIKESSMTMIPEDEVGHWDVSNIYFSMGGPARSWAVDIEAELNGQTDKARVVIDAEVR